MKGLAAGRLPRRPRPPAVHWPSIRGRARADAGPLLLAGIVVAVVTLLTSAVPPMLGATATDAVRDAVRAAGDDADLRAGAGWEYDDGPLGGRVRAPHLAEDVQDFRDRAGDALAPQLRASMRSPIAGVTSPILNFTDGSVLRTFQLAYFADDAPGGPRVTWLAGAAPGPAVSEQDREIEVLDKKTPWPVQVGLSEADAKALQVRPGARIPVADERGVPKNIQVSGIFRAADSGDPAWRLAPWLQQPVSGADGLGTTRFAGLLSPASLPDARLAFDQDQLKRTVFVSPDPDALTVDSARTLSAAVLALKASSGSSASRDTSLMWDSRLDTLLREVNSQVDVAAAQASVLLIGVLVTAVLTLLLAADLLVQRRVPVLTAARQRGAALPDLGAELLLEAATVALSAAAAGLALAAVFTSGASWRWALPVVLAAAVASPAMGVLTAARATRDRRRRADRKAHTLASRTGQLRRAAVETAVLAAAAGAAVALHQRGIVAGGSADMGAAGSDGGTVLPASAPTLAAIAGSLVLLRLLPAASRAGLRRALRSRRPLAVFGAARAVTTSTRLLPPLVLLVSTALASFALTLHTTVDRGLADGAWRAVGADARLDIATDAATSVPALAARTAAAPGVRQVVTAQVTDGSQVGTGSTLTSSRLVIVDVAAFRRLLATTALPDEPGLDQLTPPRNGDLPALVRSRTGGLRPGMRLQLLREDAPAIRLTAAGRAPVVGDAENVVLVDKVSAAAAGLRAVDNTMWVIGPGAGPAVTANTVGGHVVLREDVLRERRTAPLSSALQGLSWASVVVLLALAVLGVVLAAAARAPDRWQTLTRLRALGLRRRDVRWVAAGELLPPVVLGVVGGPLLGIMLSRLSFGSLGLRMLTGQATDPDPVLPWAELGLVSVVLLATVLAVVFGESALRRRQRLSDVLRAS